MKKAPEGEREEMLYQFSKRDRDKERENFGFQKL